MTAIVIEAATASLDGAGDSLLIGLVNNMPPAARRATERQFAGVIQAAAGGRAVRLRSFTTEVADAAESGCIDTDRLLEQMEAAELDGLIVTGMEPQAAELRDEPVWPVITRLVDWAEARAVPAIWSCLAAHAAVLYMDGVDRVPCPDKISGVFAAEIIAPEHPLLDGLACGWWAPHSRRNDLPEASLMATGYRPLLRSVDVGLDLFEKTLGAPFLFFQSHPEYAGETLLREFQRDVRRFHLRERRARPAVPRNYFPPAADALLLALQAAMAEPATRIETIEALLNRLTEQAPRAFWAAGAARFYDNWLDEVERHKGLRQPSFAELPISVSAAPEMSVVRC